MIKGEPLLEGCLADGAAALGLARQLASDNPQAELGRQVQADGQPAQLGIAAQAARLGRGHDLRPDPEDRLVGRLKVAGRGWCFSSAPRQSNAGPGDVRYLWPPLAEGGQDAEGFNAAIYLGRMKQQGFEQGVGEARVDFGFEPGRKLWGLLLAK